MADTCFNCFFSRPCGCVVKDKNLDCFKPTIKGEKQFRVNPQSEMPCYLAKNSDFNTITEHVERYKNES